MPETTACPQCRRKLVLPESVLGQTVQCPSCQATFTAALEQPAPRPPPPRELPPRSERDRPRPPFRPLEEEQAARVGTLPHRGGVILALGVAALLLSCLVLPGWVLGGIAMSMAGADLLEMSRRHMDRSGKGMTETGKTCALVAVIISTGMFLLFCILNAFP